MCKYAERWGDRGPVTIPGHEENKWKNNKKNSSLTKFLEARRAVGSIEVGRHCKTTVTLCSFLLFYQPLEILVLGFGTIFSIQ